MSSHLDDLSDFLHAPAKLTKPPRKITLLNALAVIGIIGLLIGLLLPAVRTARPAALRAQCTNNLKQIALALSSYESVYSALPPAYTVDAAGQPLHSWRTLILPFLEEQALYATIDLSKPWNDPANAKARATAVSVYRCPSIKLPASATTYLAIVAPGGCFVVEEPRRLSDITDRHGSTLMVIEGDAEHGVHWMAPLDADDSLVMGIGEKSKLDHPGGVNALFVDGSVQFLHAQFPATLRRALISISGNDNDVASAVE
jgi:prepilin-type processing-associated H-X9-DG protein